MDVGKLLEDRDIRLEYVNRNYNFPELRDGTIITNEDHFTKNLLLNLGFEKFHTVEDASVEKACEISKYVKGDGIIGFGGGKALDVAKKVSCDLMKDLILVPTAPSHDGLTSRNSSLYHKGKKKTIRTKYAKRLIIPLHLWKTSGNLKKAGICDLIANFIALQDISLAERNGKRFSELYKKLSHDAANKILKLNDEKTLSEALIISSIAMEEGSQYCSGSEHEVEKLFEKNGFLYLHGQLAGTGVLISAKVYSAYSKKLPKLRFDSETLFEKIKKKMKEKKVYEFALQPLVDKNFRPEILKKVGEIRPERFNLWNVIDSRKVDWKKIIDDVLKD